MTTANQNPNGQVPTEEDDIGAIPLEGSGFEDHPFQGVAVFPCSLARQIGEAGCGQRYWIGLSGMRQ